MPVALDLFPIVRCPLCGNRYQTPEGRDACVKAHDEGRTRGKA